MAWGAGRVRKRERIITQKFKKKKKKYSGIVTKKTNGMLRVADRTRR